MASIGCLCIPLECRGKDFMLIEKLRIYVSRGLGVLLLFVIMVSTSRWEDFYPAASGVIFLVGAVLVGVASLGRLWCSLYIAGYKTDKLITVGPYSMCRNPLYFFSLLGAIGVGFATETLLIPLFIGVAFAIYYPFVIKSEEAGLKGIHTKEFEAYYKKVPSFFPRLSYLKEPEEYIVKPVVFRHHIFDALWFIWLLGILEFTEGLHEVNILPVLLRLY